MVVIFKDTYEDLTPTQLEYIIDRFEAGKGGDVTPGPQIDRVYSAPAGAPVTLTSDVVPPKFATRAEAPAAAAPAPVAAAPAAPVADAKAEAKPSLDDPNRPATVEKPATPDDLKMISGVGPVMEAKLHDLGIYTFAQIAKWTENEIAWVDGYLAFRGRILRDDWIKQADALARGGEEEYVRVFGKKPR